MIKFSDFKEIGEDKERLDESLLDKKVISDVPNEPDSGCTIDGKELYVVGFNHFRDRVDERLPKFRELIPICDLDYNKIVEDCKKCFKGNFNDVLDKYKFNSQNLGYLIYTLIYDVEVVTLEEKKFEECVEKEVRKKILKEDIEYTSKINESYSYLLEAKKKNKKKGVSSEKKVELIEKLSTLLKSFSKVPSESPEEFSVTIPENALSDNVEVNFPTGFPSETDIGRARSYIQLIGEEGKSVEGYSKLLVAEKMLEDSKKAIKAWKEKRDEIERDVRDNFDMTDLYQDFYALQRTDKAEVSVIMCLQKAEVSEEAKEGNEDKSFADLVEPANKEHVQDLELLEGTPYISFDTFAVGYSKEGKNLWTFEQYRKSGNYVKVTKRFRKDTSPSTKKSKDVFRVIDKDVPKLQRSCQQLTIH